MVSKYKIYSYERKRDLLIGDTIKDGEEVNFYFEDEKGRKAPATEHFVEFIVDKDYKIVKDKYL